MKIKYQFCSLALASLIMTPSSLAFASSLDPNPSSLAPSSLTTPVFQAQGNDTCTITLTPGDAGSLAGRKFEVYALFSVNVAPGASSYRYDFVNSTKASLQKFVGAKTSTSANLVTAAQAQEYFANLATAPNGEAEADTSSFRTTMQEVRNQFKSDHVSATKTFTIDATDGNGSYTIEGLEKGYYLIDEIVNENSPQANSQAASLCLVSTVLDNQTLQLKGAYPTLEKKIQEDDKADLENDGWNDIGDFEVGQAIPYRYTTTIPPIGAYQSYQLVFHDKMDTALDLNKDSITISAVGKNKTYTLKNSEFQVVVNATPDSQTGETFSITIENIKAILDREFNDPNSTYGQQIVVNYQAKLNDNSAEDTGRPGFENQVRLEYSNNPDSDGQGQTGFTPWDSVVCFTFMIDGQKISEKTDTSGQPLPLANAHFRLYRDEACTNEIKVKKISGKNAFILDPNGTGEDIVSQSDGSFKIYGLDQGTYYLLETQAPDGHHKPLTCITLSLTPTYTTERDEYVEGQGSGDTILKTLQSSYQYKEYYDGQTHTVNAANQNGNVNDGSVPLSVINRSGKELPLTGGNTALISLGAGTLVVGLGLLQTFKKKKL